MAVAGGALGLAVAHWIAKAIVALAPDDLPRVADIAVDATVALFTFAAIVVVRARDHGRGAAAPGGRREPARQRSRASGRRPAAAALRTRSTLLVAQIGLSVVLLVAAGLVLRSFMALRQVDLGFTPDRVLSLTVQPRQHDAVRPTSGSRFLRACARCPASRPRAPSTCGR